MTEYVINPMTDPLEITPTPELRWRPRSMMQAFDYVLQQKWILRRGNEAWTEWRDVPKSNGDGELSRI